MRLVGLLFIVALICFILPQILVAQELAFPEIDGWKFYVEETVYTPNNLYDVIDGAADLFLEYDFVDLHIGRYARGEVEIKVESYKHQTALDAFGIYSQERFADYHFMDLGVQGYLEKGALNFLSGVFYVKISTIQEGSAAQDGMSSVAKAVEQHLRQSRSWPHLLSAFPAEQKKIFSEQYIARSFLGYSPLNNVFVASYDDGSLFRAFLMKCESAERALRIAGDLLKSLPKNATVSESAGGRVIQDPNNGMIEIRLQGAYLFGAVSPHSGKGHHAFLKEFGMTLGSIK